MSVNKNALIRYKTIDQCLRNRHRLWTLDDLVTACSDALYEYEGKYDNVSVRTVQLDIQNMRSDKLGYNAPIEVYDRKYYRYSDMSYSITKLPMSARDIEVLSEAVDLLRQYDVFDYFNYMADVVGKLQSQVDIARKNRQIVFFENNNELEGLKYLNTIYDSIVKKEVLEVEYKSFKSRDIKRYKISPYILKEYRNRWFVFGFRQEDKKLFNFALDRIEGLHISTVDEYSVDETFSSEDFFDDLIGVTKHERLKTEHIVFIADRITAQYIQTKPIHISQKLVSRDRKTGWVTFEITVVANPELYSAMFAYADGVQIISPQRVVDEMKEAVGRLATNYNLRLTPVE